MSCWPMRRLMHSSSSHGCSPSNCSCSVSSSGTSVSDRATVFSFVSFVSSVSSAHAGGERVILLFFLFFSSIGGVGERSSFLLFFVETGFAASLSGSGCLRGRPPRAPLARLVARRCLASAIAGCSNEKASLSPELLSSWSISASSPFMQAETARISRPSSAFLSASAMVAISSGSMDMLSAVVMIKKWVLSRFFFDAAKVKHPATLPPCQKSQKAPQASNFF